MGGGIRSDPFSTNGLVGGPPASIPRPGPTAPGDPSPVGGMQGAIGAAGNAGVPQDLSLIHI